MPGFKTFLEPTSFATLSSAAVDGPIIMVNISRYRSDAIILHPSTETEVVNLPKATPQELDRISSQLRKALKPFTREPREPFTAMSERRHEGVKEVLRLLWESVACPVVEALRKRKVKPGSRIWWCPTAQLCSLPLHAAGIYDDSTTVNKLPDNFISSYTPTLSALIRARRDRHPLPRQPRVLAIGVPKPNGREDDDALTTVAKEVDCVVRHAPIVTRLEDEAATHVVVLRELPAHSWAHFAGHGHQDVQNPFDSRLRLQDKPLSLLDIVQARLPNAEFAFLSACHSATGDLTTPDEGLHLAAALQFVGFRSVVGTLWMMDDQDGPDVAEAFYSFMFRQKAEPASCEDAAKGVYQITKTLRKKQVPLDRWVNFVHVGA